MLLPICPTLPATIKIVRKTRNNQTYYDRFILSTRKGMLIKRILVHVNECTKTKTTYTGDPFFHKKAGKEAIILEGSVEEKIIVN